MPDFSFAPGWTEDQTMMWLLVATGFTGAFTLLFFLRSLYRRFAVVPSQAVYFSPKGGCMDAVVREIKHARHEILVQAYSFTADPLTYGLIEAKKRGVDVKVLLDKSNEKESYSDLRIFLENDLIPLVDAEHAIAHNKVMIIDQKVLITGSYNFTNQAEHENAENLLVIKGHPELVRAYRQNFESHKAHCKAPEIKHAAGGGRRAA
jgi:phosphatidylserine/phosphatidylglycerophosphate/cardiolipin synthase-like enzyme